MECQTCRQPTKQLTDAHWCPRCGSLSINNETQQPELVNNLRSVAYKLNQTIAADDCWRHGIFQSIWQDSSEELVRRPYWERFEEIA